MSFFELNFIYCHTVNLSHFQIKSLLLVGVGCNWLCYLVKYDSNTFHSYSAASFHVRTKKLINEAIMNNDFLKKLEPQLLKQLVDCMLGSIYTEGQLVIQEGEPGNYLYVLSGYSGSLQLYFALFIYF